MVAEAASPAAAAVPVAPPSIAIPPPAAAAPPAAVIPPAAAAPPTVASALPSVALPLGCALALPLVCASYADAQLARYVIELTGAPAAATGIGILSEALNEHSEVNSSPCICTCLHSRYPSPMRLNCCRSDLGALRVGGSSSLSAFELGSIKEYAASARRPQVAHPSAFES